MKRRAVLIKQDLCSAMPNVNCPNEYMKHDDDDISVDEWIQEMEYVQKESILMYKPRGIVSEEYPSLSRENFFLIIMTNTQVQMLKSHSDKVVCATAIGGPTFKLIILMVVDSNNKGFPCLFSLTDRTDKDILRLLFSKMSKRVGTLMKPQLFISDVTHPFHSVWSRTICKPGGHIFCPWNIEDTLKNNLNRIRKKEKKQVIEETLRSIMNEPDETVFNRRLPEVVSKMLFDVDTRNFGAFVKVNFAKNPESWASCHRLRHGHATNDYVTSLRRSLENFRSEATDCKRLDKAICVALNCLFRSTVEGFISLNDDGIKKKLQDIRNHHRASLALRDTTVFQVGNKWTVSTNNECYVVIPYKEECACSLICEECKACIHCYACNCVKSAFACSMCEHVHLVLLVARKVQSNLLVRNSKRLRRRKESAYNFKSTRKDSSDAQTPRTENCKESLELEPTTPQDEHLSSSTPTKSPTTLSIATQWGVQLTSLDADQRALAEKAIADILFEASLGALHKNSVKINGRSSSVEPIGHSLTEAKLGNSKLAEFLGSFQG